MTEAEKNLENPGAYPTVQEIAEKQLRQLLDNLVESGADFKHWAMHGHFPEPYLGELNKVRYLDDFIPIEDQVQEFTIRGKKHTSVIKGDMDRTAHTRAVLQAYCKDRNLNL